VEKTDFVGEIGLNSFFGVGEDLGGVVIFVGGVLRSERQITLVLGVSTTAPKPDGTSLHSPDLDSRKLCLPPRYRFRSEKGRDGGALPAIFARCQPEAS